MQSKKETSEEHNLLPHMNDKALGRAVSDLTAEISHISEDLSLILKINEIEQVKCECCGMSEDCTPAYIGSIKNIYSGKWVCGLCSEAVKEHLQRTPTTTMKEAVDSHMAICRNFNKTTRLDPKLSISQLMRDIVKRSSQSRISKNLAKQKISRSTSCDPRIDIQIERQRDIHE